REPMACTNVFLLLHFYPTQTPTNHMDPTQMGVQSQIIIHFTLLLTNTEILHKLRYSLIKTMIHNHTQTEYKVRSAPHWSHLQLQGLHLQSSPHLQPSPAAVPSAPNFWVGATPRTRAPVLGEASIKSGYILHPEQPPPQEQPDPHPHFPPQQDDIFCVELLNLIF
ncbi:hypothetical protein, partial [Klebsiella pneumoniae]|uniref:hypothetical protein n=1 Tax=Klebsiella pneumoniae TaxID=573 RepID=UPI001D0EB62E